MVVPVPVLAVGELQSFPLSPFANIDFGSKLYTERQNATLQDRLVRIPLSNETVCPRSSGQRHWRGAGAIHDESIPPKPPVKAVAINKR